MCFSLALGCRSCPRPGPRPARAHVQARWPVRPLHGRRSLARAFLRPSRVLRRSARARRPTRTHPPSPSLKPCAVGLSALRRPAAQGGAGRGQLSFTDLGTPLQPPSPGVRGSAVMDVEPSVGRSRPAVPCGPTGANQRSGGRSNPILTSRGSLPVREPTVPPASDARAPGPVVSSDNRIAVMCHESPRCVERRPHVRPGKKSNPSAVGEKGKSPSF